MRFFGRKKHRRAEHEARSECEAKDLSLVVH
jgi:hypothetical protein